MSSILVVQKKICIPLACFVFAAVILSVIFMTKDGEHSNTDIALKKQQKITKRTLTKDSRSRLRVGIYNWIPDVKGDQLQSYVDYINKEWSKEEPEIPLTLAVDKKEYDPYGNLTKLLGTGKDSFDLIEVDMLRADELFGRVVEISSQEINVNYYFNSAVDAVKWNGKYLGYPTLSCGNFIIKVQQKQEKVYLLNDSTYDEFITSAEIARHKMVWNKTCGVTRPGKKHARLLSGRVSLTNGYFLPYTYIDGAIDCEGSKDIEKIVKEVLNDTMDQQLIGKMKAFFKLFQDNCGQIQQKNPIQGVINGENAYFYGFSENLPLIYKGMNYTDIKVAGILSPPFGSKNHLMTYTDGLVINKARYDLANKEKKSAIRKFIKFFTGSKIRTNLVMGKDLGDGKSRYLLLPFKEFYEKTDDAVYKQYYNLLKHSVAAPVISETDRLIMQKNLRKALKM